MDVHIKYNNAHRRTLEVDTIHACHMSDGKFLLVHVGGENSRNSIKWTL